MRRVNNGEVADVKRARNLADKRGWILTKVREDSKWYAGHGPWMITDQATGSVVKSSLQWPDVERELGMRGDQ